MEQQEVAFSLPEFSVSALGKMNTAEIAAKQEEQDSARDHLYDQMQSELNSDAKWDEDRLAEYKARAQTLDRIDGNRRACVDAMQRAHTREDRRPMNKRSALSRLFEAHLEKGDGRQGLEAWEADRFLPKQVDRKSVPFAALGGNSPERLSVCLAEDESAPSPFPEFYAAPQQSDTAGSKKVVRHSTSMRVHERINFFGNVSSNVKTVNTSDGNPHYELYRDATQRRGRVLNAQGKAVTKRDAAVINSVEYGALDLTSDEMPVAKRFITDFSADILGLVRREGLRGLADSWNRVCVKQPVAPADENLAGVQQGLIGMAAGQTMALADKDSGPTWAEIKQWYRLLPYSMRVDTEGNPYGFTEPDSGNITFLMHSSLYDRIFDIDDGDGRPLAQPIASSSIASGPSFMIRRIPMVANDAFDAMGTGAATGDVPGVFMNGNKFTERTVGNIWVNFHFDSRTDQTNSVSYIMWDRRFFAPNNEISAGDGVNDATRSRALARVTLP